MIKTMLFYALFQVNVCTAPSNFVYTPQYAIKPQELFYNKKLKFFYFA